MPQLQPPISISKNLGKTVVLPVLPTTWFTKFIYYNCIKDLDTDQQFQLYFFFMFLHICSAYFCAYMVFVFKQIIFLKSWFLIVDPFFIFNLDLQQILKRLPIFLLLLILYFSSCLHRLHIIWFQYLRRCIGNYNFFQT